MRDETSPIGTPSSVTGRLFRVAAVVGIVWVIGCSDAFNPSFLRMWETPGAEGTSVFTGVSLPSGHIPILFINDARIADNIFRYVIQQADTPSEDTIQEIIRLNPQLTHDTVETILKAIIADQAVDLQQIEHLPPRVRIRVNVTNVDGGVQQLEFVEGLRLARQEDSVAGTPSSGELPPPARLMRSGVGKSGSPAPKSTTSTPWARSLSASAATFMVEDTLMVEMRCEIRLVTAGMPL